MKKEANQIQSQCEAYQLAMDREDNYAIFTKEVGEVILLST